MDRHPRLRLTYYGDDFTGSTDALEALASAGIRAVLFLEPPTDGMLRRFPDLEAIGVAGTSRSMTPVEMDVALPALFARLRALGAPLCHYKVCSTFDSSPSVGSIGRAIDLARQVFATPLVPVVVGAPVLGRYVAFGNLFARSGLESEPYRLDRHPTMSHHPVTPMHESDLRLHLAAQTHKSIALASVLDLENEHSTAGRLAAVREAGAEILVFDTLDDTHLRCIGAVLWQEATRQPPLFTVGSSGVEYALTAAWRDVGAAPPPGFAPLGAVDQLVVVSGSCSPVTAGQIDWALEHGFAGIPLDSAQLVDEAGHEEEVARAVRRARAALDDGASPLLHLCRGPHDLRIAPTRRALAAAGSNARLLGRALGQIVRALAAEVRPRRVVVTGGDSSSYAARAMGIEALEMIGRLAPGSPLCRVYAEDPACDGLEIAFKGGQVGTVDYFGRVRQGVV